MKKILVITAIIIIFLTTMTQATAKEPTTPQETTTTTNQPNKLYGIGSVSKIFTAASIMKLAEENKLDLDEPITTYIPDFTMADARYTQITTRMLLNHSSGLKGMTGNNGFLTGDNDTHLHDNYLEYLKTQNLKHDPGDRSIYCNEGFTLAEIIIETISGMTYTDYITQNFAEPLGLGNIETPQSDFDWNTLAYTYLGNSELLPQTLGMIGSGGIYATMEDLCHFSTIFMDNADGTILSKTSTDEMAKIQHQMEIVPPGADTVFRYGLGWDCVEQYPFNQLGIRALSKGGSTFTYYTNLTVLPEYNLAAAVACSGDGGLESLIAQEIILAVLEEEGLIPAGTTIALPEQNTQRAKVPEDIKSNAGIYAAGMLGQYSLAFTDDSLILTPIGVRNERPMEYIYNTDGEFISTNGDFIGVFSSDSGAVGITAITFAGNYLVIQSYEDLPGLSSTAEAIPFAEKIEENPVSGDAWNAWTERNGKEYLLVSEKYTSAMYINMSLAKTMTDERIYGYVSNGIYTAGGVVFPAVRISDRDSAKGYQNIPTMLGRDIVDISIEAVNGVEYLNMNNNRFVDAAAAVPFSALGDRIIINSEPVWVDIDEYLGGKTVSVSTPGNGSWFVFDDKMTCLATSLERTIRSTIILPENGRLVFAGEPGAEFALQ